MNEYSRDYVAPHVGSFAQGLQELKDNDLDTFEGVRLVTRSALKELERLRREGGRRWDQIRDLVLNLERDQPGEITRRLVAPPDLQETYVKRIGNEHGIRIIWTVDASATVVAVEYYPHPERSV